MNMKLIGNAIVGQSGGPTAAINATLAGVIRGALAAEEIKTLYGAFNGVEGMLAGTICNLSEIFANEADIITLEHTPAAALGSCRLKLPKIGEKDEVYEKLFDFFRANDIRYFFYIGGNDSMDTVAKLSAYSANHDWKMNVMGVPKTIDCDLAGTDHTPGYGSAAKYIAASMQEILRDCAVYTVKAVTIVEIMGRDAGWLTCAAALPKDICGVAPDLIYLPERTFNYDEFYEDVAAALERHPNVVVAVSEGIRLADGTYVGEGSQSGAVDIFGHKYLSGTGKTLEQAVKGKLGCKVRSVELNILQRCASHVASETDLSESVAVGRAAVEGAVNGMTGRMMNFVREEGEEYKISIGSEDIQKIANAVRTVPDEFINERGNYVTDACIAYIKPLIMGEPKIEYKDGLPVHFEIKR
ncbi:MAG: 6-phosphofructokinase [Clostridia bacterium]|nr:6-phosphofructokinase [Clostridia bacterium]